MMNDTGSAVGIPRWSLVSNKLKADCTGGPRNAGKHDNYDVVCVEQGVK